MRGVGGLAKGGAHLRWSGIAVRFCASGDNHECVIGQGALQGQCVLNRGGHPVIDCFLVCQNGRHGFGMKRGDQLIGLGREKGEQIIDGLAFLDLPD